MSKPKPTAIDIPRNHRLSYSCGHSEFVPLRSTYSDAEIAGIKRTERRKLCVRCAVKAGKEGKP